MIPEHVEAYNTPQGLVRGATLELLDITYDGVEDPVTGFLRGGLGQLVDGKYGSEDFRAFGENGVIRGRRSLSKSLHIYPSPFSRL